jgi:hypothetical protein
MGVIIAKKLKCVKEPLSEFKCSEMPTLKIENAGACFVAITQAGAILIRDCPSFQKVAPISYFPRLPFGI